MYAVIETGGKQYRVETGDVIDVELAPVSGKKVRKVKFDRVLLVGGDKGVKVGDPLVTGAEVTGVLVDEVRGPKIRVFKMKRRKGYRRTRGHRQDLLRVKIDGIKAGRASTGKIKQEEEAAKEAKED
jgi:large subunit ribosomal protein L21